MLKISFFGSGPALARGPIEKGRPGPGPGPGPGPRIFAGPGPRGRAGPTKKKARNNTNACFPSLFMWTPSGSIIFVIFGGKCIFMSGVFSLIRCSSSFL